MDAVSHLEALRAGSLHGAKSLRLRSLNGEFPREIFDLADTLEILDLNGNGLSSLPDDFNRLTQLRILFLSENDFEWVPDVLSACPKLGMIGFKSCRLKEIPEDALPLSTHWLILTDNQLPVLPTSMGKLTGLRKCMLAGNELSALPASMENCRELELLRLSANRFDALPDFLFSLPKLSWLTFAGNPLHRSFETGHDLPEIHTSAFERLDQLGEGASGIIHRARWTDAAPAPFRAGTDFASKAYRKDITSDGFVADEVAAAIAAGHHPSLVQLLARVRSDDCYGLAMSLIPDGYFTLGAPPTFETCTRDYFPADQIMSAERIHAILKDIAGVMLHLRQRGISHNDLYAHNILVSDQGRTILTDFGAAANYASLPDHQKAGLEHLEVRAFGCLMEDLIGLVPRTSDPRLLRFLGTLRNACLHPDVSARPGFAEICEELIRF